MSQPGKLTINDNGIFLNGQQLPVVSIDLKVPPEGFCKAQAELELLPYGRPGAVEVTDLDVAGRCILRVEVPMSQNGKVQKVTRRFRVIEVLE